MVTWVNILTSILRHPKCYLNEVLKLSYTDEQDVTRVSIHPYNFCKCFPLWRSNYNDNFQSCLYYSTLTYSHRTDERKMNVQVCCCHTWLALTKRVSKCSDSYVVTMAANDMFSLGHVCISKNRANDFKTFQINRFP